MPCPATTARKAVSTFWARLSTQRGFWAFQVRWRPRAARLSPALTIPSYRDLATGRVVHFFFAWVLVATLLLWFTSSLFNGHLKDISPSFTDIRSLPRDFVEHLKFRFQHGKSYNPLQKLSYFLVLFGLFPLIVATGLAMSPGADSILPLSEWLGGRQTARTLHFVAMLLLVAFFIVHIAMVLAAGPFNELRSMISGWYRIDRTDEKTEKQS